MFVDVSKLPQSNAEGPQDWGEAWSRLAGASDDTQKLIENFNAGPDALEEAYDRRIRAIEQITGTSLPNPLRTASEREKGLAHLQTGMIPIGELMPDLRQEEEAEFDRKARVLAERYPQVNAVLATGIEEQRNQVMRDTQAEASRAAQSYALGPVGRFTAQLVGGLKGGARDPYQWGMATFGAGPSAATTVAGRIGQTMATEFLLNGGQELVLQVASQERKREAGLEHGLGDILANVGIAGTFGSLFGGTVQGGAELARILKLGEGGAERATRIIEGRPEPGDVEAFAAAAGIELADDTRAQLARSFEERVLDDVMIPENATADDITLMRAALRYAEDPDNFPSPDILERALADSSDAGGRTLSADDYMRIYDGDEAAIDVYRDRVSASSATSEAAVRGGAPVRQSDQAAAPSPSATRDAPAGRAGAELDPARAAARSSEGVDIADTFDVDPVRGQTIRPQQAVEPFDDAAMVKAETLAGDIVDPVLDMEGRPQTLFDLVPLEDGDGNVRLVSTREALEVAEIPTFHADLLEACKL